MGRSDSDIIVDLRLRVDKAERELSRFARKAERTQINLKGIDHRKFTQPLGKISGSVSEFNKSLEASNARVIAFTASAGVLFTVTKAFTEMAKATVEVERTLADINVILGANTNNLKKFGNGLFDIAKKTGQAFSEVGEAAGEFARQGLSMEKTLTRTRDALILMRLSGMDAQSAVNSLTAAINSFNKSAITSTEIINRMANVDAAFAVSTNDLAEAIRRVGASAEGVNVSFNELLAVTTSVQQTTARGGNVIGNSLKTIFTRIQRTEVINQLSALGVAVKSTSGEMRPAMNILKDLAKAYGGLTPTLKAQTAELVGGVYQMNILKAILKDLGSGYSTYSQALSTANNSTDEAITRNAELNKTMAAMLNETMQNLTKMGSDIGKLTFEPVFKKLLGGMKSLSEETEIFGDIGSLFGIDEAEAGKFGKRMGEGIFKSIGNFLQGPGLIALVSIAGKLFLDFTKFLGKSTVDMMNLNKGSQQQAAIQQQIAATLQSSPALIKQIETGERTRLQVEQDILAALKVEIKQREMIAKLSKGMSGGVMAGGVTARIDKGAGTTTLVGKSAGHIPNFRGDSQEFMGAVMGGYSPGDIRQRFIPNYGNVTYNTAEKVKYFPNFKQPAIMPPAGSRAGASYKSDFKDAHGFNPYSSAGLIPNFAAVQLSNKQGRNIVSSKTEKNYQKIKLTDNEAGRVGVIVSNKGDMDKYGSVKANLNIKHAGIASALGVDQSRLAQKMVEFPFEVGGFKDKQFDRSVAAHLDPAIDSVISDLKLSQPTTEVGHKVKGKKKHSKQTLGRLFETAVFHGLGIEDAGKARWDMPPKWPGKANFKGLEDRNNIDIKYGIADSKDNRTAISLLEKAIATTPSLRTKIKNIVAPKSATAKGTTKGGVTKFGGHIPNFQSKDPLERALQAERKGQKGAEARIDPKTGLVYVGQPGQPSDLRDLIKKDHPEGFAKALENSRRQQARLGGGGGYSGKIRRSSTGYIPNFQEEGGATGIDMAAITAGGAMAAFGMMQVSDQFKTLAENTLQLQTKISDAAKAHQEQTTKIKKAIDDEVAARRKDTQTINDHKAAIDRDKAALTDKRARGKSGPTAAEQARMETKAHSEARRKATATLAPSGSGRDLKGMRRMDMSSPERAAFDRELIAAQKAELAKWRSAKAQEIVAIRNGIKTKEAEIQQLMSERGVSKEVINQKRKELQASKENMVALRKEAAAHNKNAVTSKHMVSDTAIGGTTAAGAKPGKAQSYMNFMSGGGAMAGMMMMPMVGGMARAMGPSDTAGKMRTEKAVSGVEGGANIAMMGAMTGNPYLAVIAGVVGAFQALEGVMDSQLSTIPKLTANYEEAKQKLADFNTSSQRYLTAFSKFDEALTDSSIKPEDYARREKELADALMEVPADMQAKIAAAAGDTEKIKRLFGEMAEELRNAERQGAGRLSFAKEIEEERGWFVDMFRDYKPDENAGWLSKAFQATSRGIGRTMQWTGAMSDQKGDRMFGDGSAGSRRQEAFGGRLMREIDPDALKGKAGAANLALLDNLMSGLGTEMDPAELDNFVRILREMGVPEGYIEDVKELQKNEEDAAEAAEDLAVAVKTAKEAFDSTAAAAERQKRLSAINHQHAKLMRDVAEKTKIVNAILQNRIGMEKEYADTLSEIRNNRLKFGVDLMEGYVDKSFEGAQPFMGKIETQNWKTLIALNKLTTENIEKSRDAITSSINEVWDITNSQMTKASSQLETISKQQASGQAEDTKMWRDSKNASAMQQAMLPLIETHLQSIKDNPFNFEANKKFVDELEDAFTKGGMPNAKIMAEEFASDFDRVESSLQNELAKISDNTMRQRLLLEEENIMQKQLLRAQERMAAFGGVKDFMGDAGMNLMPKNYEKIDKIFVNQIKESYSQKGGARAFVPGRAPEGPFTKATMFKRATGERTKFFEEDPSGGIARGSKALNALDMLINNINLRGKTGERMGPEAFGPLVGMSMSGLMESIKLQTQAIQANIEDLSGQSVAELAAGQMENATKRAIAAARDELLRKGKPQAEIDAINWTADKARGTDKGRSILEEAQANNIASSFKEALSEDARKRTAAEQIGQQLKMREIPDQIIQMNTGIRALNRILEVQGNSIEDKNRSAFIAALRTVGMDTLAQDINKDAHTLARENAALDGERSNSEMKEHGLQRVEMGMEIASNSDAIGDTVASAAERSNYHREVLESRSNTQKHKDGRKLAQQSRLNDQRLHMSEIRVRRHSDMERNFLFDDLIGETTGSINTGASNTAKNIEQVHSVNEWGFSTLNDSMKRLEFLRNETQAIRQVTIQSKAVLQELVDKKHFTGHDDVEKYMDFYTQEDVDKGVKYDVRIPKTQQRRHAAGPNKGKMITSATATKTEPLRYETIQRQVTPGMIGQMKGLNENVDKIRSAPPATLQKGGTLAKLLGTAQVQFMTAAAHSKYKSDHRVAPKLLPGGPGVIQSRTASNQMRGLVLPGTRTPGRTGAPVLGQLGDNIFGGPQDGRGQLRGMAGRQALAGAGWVSTRRLAKTLTDDEKKALDAAMVSGKKEEVKKVLDAAQKRIQALEQKRFDEKHGGLRGGKGAVITPTGSATRKFSFGNRGPLSSDFDLYQSGAKPKGDRQYQTNIMAMMNDPILGKIWERNLRNQRSGSQPNDAKRLDQADPFSAVKAWARNVTNTGGGIDPSGKRRKYVRQSGAGADPDAFKQLSKEDRAFSLKVDRLMNILAGAGGLGNSGFSKMMVGETLGMPGGGTTGGRLNHAPIYEMNDILDLLKGIQKGPKKAGAENWADHLQTIDEFMPIWAREVRKQQQSQMETGRGAINNMQESADAIIDETAALSAQTSAMDALAKAWKKFNDARNAGRTIAGKSDPAGGPEWKFGKTDGSGIDWNMVLQSAEKGAVTKAINLRAALGLEVGDMGTSHLSGYAGIGQLGYMDPADKQGRLAAFNYSGQYMAGGPPGENFGNAMLKNQTANIRNAALQRQYMLGSSGGQIMGKQGPGGFYDKFTTGGFKTNMFQQGELVKGRLEGNQKYIGEWIDTAKELYGSMSAMDFDISTSDFRDDWEADLSERARTMYDTLAENGDITKEGMDKFMAELMAIKANLKDFGDLNKASADARERVGRLLNVARVAKTAGIISPEEAEAQRQSLLKKYSDNREMGATAAWKDSEGDMQVALADPLTTGAQKAAAVSKRRAMAVQAKEYSESFGLTFKAIKEKWTKSAREMAEEGQQAIMAVGDTFKDGVNDAVWQWIKGTKDIKESFGDLFQSIGDMAAKMALEMAMQTFIFNPIMNSFKKGGEVKGYNKGGYVSTGIRGKDTEPAYLEKGEFVIKSDTVDKVGLNFLTSLNSMAGFNSGGHKLGNESEINHAIKIGQAAAGNRDMMKVKGGGSGEPSLGVKLGNQKGSDYDPIFGGGPDPQSGLNSSMISDRDYASIMLRNAYIYEKDGKSRYELDKRLSQLALGDTSNSRNQFRMDKMSKLMDQRKGRYDELVQWEIDKAEAAEKKSKQMKNMLWMLGGTLLLSQMLGGTATGDWLGLEGKPFGNKNNKFGKGINSLFDWSGGGNKGSGSTMNSNSYSNYEDFHGGMRGGGPGGSGPSSYEEYYGGRALGGSIEDKELSLLSKGEYVVPKDTVDRLGVGWFDNLNKSGRIKAYAEGGYVGDTYEPKTASEGDEGSTNNVNITVNIDQNGGTDVDEGGVMSESSAKDLGQLIKSTVVSVLVNQKRPGGMLYNGNISGT